MRAGIWVGMLIAALGIGPRNVQAQTFGPNPTVPPTSADALGGAPAPFNASDGAAGVSSTGTPSNAAATNTAATIPGLPSPPADPAAPGAAVAAPPLPTAPAPATVPSAERTVPVSYMRQAIFSIPFQVGGDTTEVQLYVSIDQGATWHLYAQQRPDTKRFRFRASQDGEFWFASRTVNRAGQGRPETINRPERRVIVDQRQPRVDVGISVSATGELQAQWTIEEENLLPTSLKVGYRTDTQPNWQLLPVAPPQPGAGNVTAGQASWRAPAGAKVVQVHLEVADQAGNWGVVEKQQGIVPTTPGSANSGPSALGASTGLPPRDRSSTSTNGTGVGKLTAAELGRATDGSNSTGGATSGSATSGSVSGNAVGGGDAASSAVDIAGDDRPRMTSSKKFSLEYDIESAGPGGVAEVELWISKDRGATWSRQAVDPDKTSPFDVEVDSDGVYGVRIVIVSKSGLASTAPRPGDPADLWVGVDTTRPTAQFSSVSYGEGANAGQLDIRWVADDQRFGPRPIGLSYAETAAGPWTPIASGLANTGQYFWSVDPYVPKKILLRIEARDEAGNVTQHDLQEPISLQGLSPAARIRGVQPR